MEVTEAGLFHMEKMDITENLFNLANRSLNPSMNQIRYLRSSWVRRNVGGFDQHSMVEMLDEYRKQNPEITIQVCSKLRTYFLRWRQMGLILYHLIRRRGERGRYVLEHLHLLGAYEEFHMVGNLHIFVVCSLRGAVFNKGSKFSVPTWGWRLSVYCAYHTVHAESSWVPARIRGSCIRRLHQQLRPAEYGSNAHSLSVSCWLSAFGSHFHFLTRWNSLH